MSSNLSTNIDHNGNTSAPAEAHLNKTGRKGDPRMHAAVAARLANPSLSLFAALRAGGFNYENEDEGSALDSEKVTLAQRKNQLSRRIRFAKQHGEFEDYRSSSPQLLPPLHSLKNGNDDMNGHMHYPEIVETRSGRKRSASNAVGDELSDAPPAEHVDAQTGCYYGHEAAPKPKCCGPDGGLAIKAKNHPDFHPIIVQPTGNIGTGSMLMRAHVNLLPGWLGPKSTCTQSPSLNYLLHQNSHPAVSYGMTPTTSTDTTNPAIPYTATAEGGRLVHPATTVIMRKAPSAVAISTLTATAKSMGMTLEQLALALTQCPNLEQILKSGDPVFKYDAAGRYAAKQRMPSTSSTGSNRQESMALNLYENDIFGLYSRCMLLAGYAAEETTQGSPSYIEFALKAWNAEGKRLHEMMNEKQHQRTHDDKHSNRHSSGDNVSTREEAGTEHFNDNDEKVSLGDAMSDAQWHSLHACSGNKKPKATRKTAGDRSDSLSLDDCAVHVGHHIHRLEGCGHRPIVHQPENGPVHIDFIIGDKVECYEGVHPFEGNNSTSFSLWPSQYRCDDLGCEKNQCPSEMASLKHSDECRALGVPKILDLDCIDFNGKEWGSNMLNGQIDETLLGLFKLSDTKSEDQHEL